MAVTLHTYTKTEYKDAPAHKTTPLSAANLNNNEDGTEQLYTDLAAVYKQQQDDLTNVSQTGSTASQAISAGTYFYLDGTLVRAKTAIASGATFTENTNYEVVTAGALNDISKWTLVDTVSATNTPILLPDSYREILVVVNETSSPNFSYSMILPREALISSYRTFPQGSMYNSSNGDRCYIVANLTAVSCGGTWWNNGQQAASMNMSVYWR